MPCNSSYMEPTKLEKNLSDVFILIDETMGKGLSDLYRTGQDPRVYNKGLSQDHLDAKVSELCERLQKIEAEGNIGNYSLELQTWWRDHKKADEERIKRELAEIKEAQEREIALAKLTPHERELLGF